MLGRWLPAALADVVGALLALAGVREQRSERLASWGLAHYAAQQRAMERDAAEHERTTGLDRLEAHLDRIAAQ